MEKWAGLPKTGRADPPTKKNRVGRANPPRMSGLKSQPAPPKRAGGLARQFLIKKEKEKRDEYIPPKRKINKI